MPLQQASNLRRINRLTMWALLIGTSMASANAIAADTAATAKTVEARKGEIQLEEIVVTGSILRRTAKETASPITVLTTDILQKRGINTIEQALQLSSANNGGNLSNSFSANGAFAGGASAVSLRGLTTSSTLVLFDGLRETYYPLADDGTRNFVDLNTIPDAIVERVDILKDGASATYGADAVAGVVNVITKRQINGFETNLESGISNKGDAFSTHASTTYGYGKLDQNGFNAYISADYEHDNALFNSDRGFPYNTGNQSRISGLDANGNKVYAQNANANGIQGDGSYAGASGSGTVDSTTVAIVRAATSDGTVLPGSTFRLLNPAAGCRGLTPHTLTSVQDPNGFFSGPICEQDIVGQYGVIQPNQTRYGASSRITAKVGDRAEAYGIFTFRASDTSFSGTPSLVNDTTTPAAAGTTTYTTTSLVLPVTLTNGTSNPNNPFAKDQQFALINYRFGDIPVSDLTQNRVFRAAAGIKGTVGNGWEYGIDFVGSLSNLTAVRKGRLFVSHLLSAVADGSYNFVNPEQNTQTVKDFLAPVSILKSNSRLYQAQINLGKELMELPGGSLKLGVGASIRRETLNNPSSNPDNSDPTQRYFNINAVSAVGARTVTSANFELDAPIIKQIEATFAGRYDHYSAGASNFSPKVGIKLTPVKQVVLRGTYSTGFRIGSFAETGPTSSTGFVSTSPPASFQALHPNAAGDGPNNYAQSYFYGLTTFGNPNLKPEKSRNFTAGTVIEPVRWLNLSVDYYNIKKTGAIVAADPTAAINAYYAGTPIPVGFTVTADVPDPSFPNAPKRLGFVSQGYVNANSIKTSGIDFSATVRIPINYDIKLTSSVDGTYIFNYDQISPNGDIQRYAGTLGNFQITSGSGTPRWHGTWQNTLEVKDFTLSATAQYVSGYKSTAEDQGGAGSQDDCAKGIVTTSPPLGNAKTYADGVTPITCNVKSFLDVDMTASYKINDNFTFYTNVLNVLNVKAPYDPTTYGGFQYNPAFANAGIIGRFIRIGVRGKF